MTETLKCLKKILPPRKKVDMSLITLFPLKVLSKFVLSSPQCIAQVKLRTFGF
jgi:hypothetical protein